MAQPLFHNPETGRENIPLQFDEDGFLINTEAWNRETANLMAELDGIGELGPQHWAVIEYLRKKHLEFGGLPIMSRVCRSANLGKHGVHELFGNCRRAWRIAGLPNPGEEAKSYML